MSLLHSKPCNNPFTQEKLRSSREPTGPWVTRSPGQPLGPPSSPSRSQGRGCPLTRQARSCLGPLDAWPVPGRLLPGRLGLCPEAGSSRLGSAPNSHHSPSPESALVFSTALTATCHSAHPFPLSPRWSSSACPTAVSLGLSGNRCPIIIYRTTNEGVKKLGALR